MLSPLNDSEARSFFFFFPAVRILSLVFPLRAPPLFFFRPIVARFFLHFVKLEQAACFVFFLTNRHPSPDSLLFSNSLRLRWWSGRCAIYLKIRLIIPSLFFFSLPTSFTPPRRGFPFPHFLCASFRLYSRTPPRPIGNFYAL